MVVAGSAVLLASGFGNGLNYLFGIFLARSLGADQFGLYALGFTFFTTLSMVVPLGIDAGAIKFISEYKTKCRSSEGLRNIVCVKCCWLFYAMSIVHRPAFALLTLLLLWTG